MKVLILDGQLLQTDAWHRGMGKYMLQVMKRMSESVPEFSLAVIFNDAIQTDEIRYETLTYLCPNFEQIHTTLPLPVKGTEPDEKKYIKALDTFLADRYPQVDQISFMLTSLFLFDVYSEFPTLAAEKTIIFYDLIPFMNWKDLGGYFPPELYMRRFGRLDEADTVFCISETTRQDVMDVFGLPEVKTLNINGGFTDHHNDSVKPMAFMVPKKYILFPTGDLPHKNNDLVFKAFKEVVKNDSDVYLLITSKFNEKTQARLHKLCPKNTIFTGNISDEELQYLYQNASIVLFGSRYEGLGLPVLDAVFHNKPVVASEIRVFTEMSTEAFYYFDVKSVSSAVAAIKSALQLEAIDQKLALYSNILQTYDWSKVSSDVIGKLSFQKSFTEGQAEVVKIKRVAFVSPNPGVDPSRYSLAEKTFFRLRRAGIIPDYYFDSEGKNHTQMTRPTFLDHLGVKVYDIKRLTVAEYKEYDVVLYAADSRSLRYKLGRAMAVLPGNVLIDKSADKSEILYKIVTEMAESVDLIDMNTSGNESTFENQVSTIRRLVSATTKVNTTTEFIKSNRSLRAKRVYTKKRIG